ncbi:Pyridoxamine 5'-phosphate oxidase [Nonomuraea solani]|uniref:Pyridoxamine 5'-phosphate oxidase n=1 Tax=Nonomuraea solani TaxID=1144553 RepID=A0A1H6ERG0_9ACTN|nr:pyridoxamine 5'-phosphate oxidase family protein [Nonomuraea solani]SEH00003.1 Pyridoxamine 5'-phosphate oxidase [Nonomuraea solani]
MNAWMTVEERESFLAGTRIGVLSVAEGEVPLSVPIWYGYEPGGDIRISTPEGSRKLRAVRAAGQAGFTVQQEAMPYRYVSVEGSVAGYEATDPAEYLEWSIRYLGDDDGRRFFQAIEEGLSGWVTVRLRPGKWRTYDFGKEFTTG